jgi:hypothetical protein
MYLHGDANDEQYDPEDHCRELVLTGDNRGDEPGHDRCDGTAYETDDEDRCIGSERLAIHDGERNTVLMSSVPTGRERMQKLIAPDPQYRPCDKSRDHTQDDSQHYSSKKKRTRESDETPLVLIKFSVVVGELAAIIDGRRVNSK